MINRYIRENTVFKKYVALSRLSVNTLMFMLPTVTTISSCVPLV